MAIEVDLRVVRDMKGDVVYWQARSAFAVSSDESVSLVSVFSTKGETVKAHLDQIVTALGIQDRRCQEN